MIRNVLLFIVSFIVVAWGQPDTSPVFSLLTSGCGFALFWLILFSYPNKKTRFLLSTLWFTAIQAVQLAWLATPEYQGVYIFFVYGALILFLGVEFGFLSLWFPMSPPLDFKRLLMIASLWTLLEWSRILIFCGFTWNPIGLSMTAYPISSQLASVWGVFGLSFWVCVVNLLVLSALVNRNWRRGGFASAAFFVPFLFGFAHMKYHEMKSNGNKKSYHIALIQTALLPEEKTYFYNQSRAFISPYEQWESMIHYLDEKGQLRVDLIVMPESVVPFGAHAAIYAYEDVEHILNAAWGKKSWAHLLGSSLAEQREVQGKKRWYVNNLFWAQALADHYEAEVVLGLDDTDEEKEETYNAAFHVTPHVVAINRYEKRILLPLAEYLPFSFLKPLVARYGIADFFTKGKEAKVFEGRCPLNISICYEECFSHLIREGKLNGAKLFVNVTNDAWYPSSRLHLKHFNHGKLRAIENGIPLVRACNTGVTAAIDSLGRVVRQLGKENLEWQRGALIAELDLYSYSTIYTYFGDYLIIAVSLFFLIMAIVSSRKST